MSVIITQLFIYTPAIHYHRNGDPGEPESYDEVGDATIMHAERPFEVLPDWVENNINWDAFLDAPLTPIH